MMEIPYYKWYNEVWPTLYNKDPDGNLLKGTINIVKRDSLKSKGDLSRNAANNSSLNSNNLKSSKSGHSRNNRGGGMSSLSNNSIKQHLNMRISANSSQRKNSQASGGPQRGAFFMPPSL